jgi:hypothetical protein
MWRENSASFNARENHNPPPSTTKTNEQTSKRKQQQPHAPAACRCRAGGRRMLRAHRRRLSRTSSGLHPSCGRRRRMRRRGVADLPLQMQAALLTHSTDHVAVTVKRRRMMRRRRRRRRRGVQGGTRGPRSCASCLFLWRRRGAARRWLPSAGATAAWRPHHARAENAYCCCCCCCAWVALPTGVGLRRSGRVGHQRRR